MTDEVKVHHLVACDLAVGSPDVRCSGAAGRCMRSRRATSWSATAGMQRRMWWRIWSPRGRASRRRRPRKPSIGKMIMQMEKAGKPVRSVTTSDGTTLTFGEPEPIEERNPWLADLEKYKQ